MLEEDTQNDPGICCKNSERTCAGCFSKSMMLQEKYLDATKRFSVFYVMFNPLKGNSILDFSVIYMSS